MRSTISRAALALGLALSASSLSAQSATRVAYSEPDLTTVRAATARFRDVKVALAEGYIRDPGNLCDNAEMMGRPASLGACRSALSRLWRIVVSSSIAARRRLAPARATAAE